MFENLMILFQEWCDSNQFQLFQPITDARYEPVKTHEFRTHMQGVDNPDEFLQRFWDCWERYSWKMVFVDECINDVPFPAQQFINVIKETTTTTCIGCLQDQPNQLAHMDIGGCLYQDSDYESE